jgi:hypothetical protein
MEEEERSQGHNIEMNSNATLKEGNEIVPVTRREERTRTLGSHNQRRDPRLAQERGMDMKMIPTSIDGHVNSPCRRECEGTLPIHER